MRATVIAPLFGRPDGIGLLSAGGIAMFGIACIAGGIRLPGRLRPENGDPE